ncbi:hypothetical protein ABZ330_07595 [Streptomyces sp. NPDC006172]|uniref:hypothetical protein n=1 Tax=Streptomyces sp. NPDC006172 TaxID=3154470 RepID=UPI0033DC49F4
MQTIAIVLLTCVLLAFLAGLVGQAYDRDPVTWAAWTFSTLATLGVAICFGLWATEA